MIARSVNAGALALLLTVAGCARVSSSGPTPVAGDAVVSDRLMFGRNIASGGTVTDSAWSVFLTEVVTPRLPSGFTVYRTEGQWRGDNGVIVREDGFVLEVHHPKGQPADSVFEAIAAAYNRRFQQEAVLRVRSPAEQWLIRGRAP